MIDSTISHYKILEKLGEGGMGIVYKATDTKLNRTVALKLLPEHISASESDSARFMQEAQAAASLNHPNICTIHGIEEADGKHFIVMEFVDGKMLEEVKSTLSQKQAIEIGIQIAEGLAAAHEKGIVHRDIKPENVMIRKDGRVLIMDFGLAKLRGASRLTKEGSTVGTAGYMSPEQVQGQETDHRSDIFSLGVLIFEMLTGQPPFKGVHETAISYEIVNVDSPPMSSLKPEIPPELDAIVLECLEKDPNDRTQSARQVAVDLKRYKRDSSRQRASRVTAAHPAIGPSVSASSRGSQSPEKLSGRLLQLPWIAAALFFVGMATFAAMYFIRPSEKKTIVRSSLLPPEQVSHSTYFGGGQFAISPDGLKLAFVATDSSGRNRLWIRSLNTLTALSLAGTEGASYPFWSPDNRFIGFFSSAKLKKIDAAGGPPLALCDAPDARGGSWGKDGVILFAPNWIGGLYQVSAAGGIPSAVTKLDTTRREQTHRWPWFLPDGKHFLYFARASAGGAETQEDAVVVSALDRPVNNRLFSASSNVAYASGHILFMRQSVLMAIPFDTDSQTLSGDAFPITEQVGYEVSFNRGCFSVSENGVLVHQQGGLAAGARFTWFDRTGKQLRTVGEAAEYGGGSLSRDEKRLAISVYDPQSRNRDIWIYDLSRGIRTRFTFDPGVEDYAVWSADESHIIYCSDKKGHLDIYQKAVGGEGGEEILLESKMDKYPTDRSSDGRFLLYYSAGNPETKSDIWVLPLSGERKPTLVLQTVFEESDASFSHDGKWIVYTSNESGRYEVYVRPFPGPGGKWQVSTSGLNPNLLVLAARWRRDGKEVYYHAADHKLMAVEIKTSGSSLEVGAVRPMFDTQSQNVLYLAAAGDGQRFLVTATVGRPSTPLTLVLNWDEELKRK